MDSTAHFAQMVACLQPHTGSSYRYPDTCNAMEHAAFPMAKRQEEQDRLQELLDLAVPGTRPVPGVALDAGCGLGVHTPRLARMFQHVLAVDADAGRVQQTRQEVSTFDNVQAFPLRLDDPVLDGPPFAGRFALVHCMQVLGHTPLAATSHIVNTIANLLHPGGHLLLGVPYVNGPRDEFWVAKLDEEDAEDDDCFASYLTNPGEYEELATRPRPGLLPVRHYAMASLDRMLSAAGLQVRQRVPYNWFTETRADLLVLAHRP